MCFTLFMKMKVLNEYLEIFDLRFFNALSYCHQSLHHKLFMKSRFYFKYW